MRHPFLLLGVTAIVLGSATPAAAEETKASRRALEIQLKIAGRRQIPMVIDVARAEPRLGVADLKRGLVDRIERAVSKEPF